jgi:flagellar biosynthesis protein FlhA
MATNLKGNKLQKFIIHTSMPVALIFILGILVFPIPTSALDVFLALNITISLIVLFVSLYIDRPLNFSSFPAILLITTLFRLAMNVATARLILLHGHNGTDAAGHVIQAFGEFVVGGNFVVGSVIFILISIVNLKVITKGSGRIAEVAARFTLDAMPGKQMAIDSDLSSGMINDKEAKIRRKELSMEAEFYGAMDGAAKFVGGDAIAGIFILFINIIGGFLVGCFMKGMDWQEAIRVYIILTIGDGLVSQIPSIIISVASGLIVARAASGEDLGSDVIGQLGASSKPLFLASAVCGAFAILPGLPFLPFFVLSGLCVTAGYFRDKITSQHKVLEDKKAHEHKEEANKPKPGSTEEVTGLLGIDTLELEVGFELVSLVESGDLVERIRSIRRQFALDYGFIVPPIHIRDNVRIKSNEYRFMLKGAVIGSSELKPHHMLAMDPGNVSSPIDGTPTKEPSFGLDALWINDTDKERAQFSGYTVVDLPTVITTHLTELVRANMAELLGRQDVQHLLDTVSKEAPKVVEELIPSLLTVGQVQQVLRLLLKEQISIRDLKTVLETLADWAPTLKHPEKLSEFVRRRLARSITSKYLSPEGTLPLASLNPGIERTLGEAVQQTDEGSYLALEPGYAQRLINRLTQISEKFMERGLTPVVLAPGHVRAALAHFIDRFTPGIAVISHQEIAPNTRVQSLGIVAIEE